MGVCGPAQNRAYFHKNHASTISIFKLLLLPLFVFDYVNNMKNANHNVERSTTENYSRPYLAMFHDGVDVSIRDGGVFTSEHLVRTEPQRVQQLFLTQLHTTNFGGE